MVTIVSFREDIHHCKLKLGNYLIEDLACLFVNK